MTPKPGEFDLIAWLRDRAANGPRTRIGIGDDCAALSVSPGSELLVTTDMLMDGRHFRLGEATAEQVGYKALAVNLSDIAAMAGEAIAAVVAVALPRNHAPEIFAGLFAGMAPLAARFGVSLIGGDTNAWDGPLVISVTVLGESRPPGPVLRSGAKVGDAILVTGPLGGSLNRGRHLRPEPRLIEARAIASSVPIHAMIDLSDGLSSDLRHILDASGGIGANLYASAIPIHEDVAADGRPPLEHALDDGEDFELCLTMGAEDAARLLATPPAGVRLYKIGEIIESSGLGLVEVDGARREISPGGYDHLR